MITIGSSFQESAGCCPAAQQFSVSLLTFAESFPLYSSPQFSNISLSILFNSLALKSSPSSIACLYVFSFSRKKKKSKKSWQHPSPGVGFPLNETRKLGMFKELQGRSLEIHATSRSFGSNLEILRAMIRWIRPRRIASGRSTSRGIHRFYLPRT